MFGDFEKNIIKEIISIYDKFGYFDLPLLFDNIGSKIIPTRTFEKLFFSVSNDDFLGHFPYPGQESEEQIKYRISETNKLLGNLSALFHLLKKLENDDFILSYGSASSNKFGINTKNKTIQIKPKKINQLPANIDITRYASSRFRINESLISFVDNEFKSNSDIETDILKESLKTTKQTLKDTQKALKHTRNTLIATILLGGGSLFLADDIADRTVNVEVSNKYTKANEDGEVGVKHIVPLNISSDEKVISLLESLVGEKSACTHINHSSSSQENINSIIELQKELARLSIESKNQAININSNLLDGRIVRINNPVEKDCDLKE